MRFLLFLCAFLLLGCPGGAAAFCFEEAGEIYGISPLLLRAIAEVESNLNPVAINWNANGTYDYGLMQINSSWAQAMGLENWFRLGEPCFNVKVGAWILARCIQRYGYTWEAVGCYNAGSPAKRAIYIGRIYRKISELVSGK